MSQRLASLDALRGCTVAAMLLVNDPGDWGQVYWPLEHAVWNGCRHLKSGDEPRV